MWPRALSRQIREDRLRSAEVKIFDALERSLMGSWSVFYSRPWLGLTATGSERDGECDFVVVHPDHGILALEVKGGEIAYDAVADRWTSRDRDGVVWEIKNPVEQARKSKHELLKKARTQRGWPKEFVRFRHSVIFPDAPRVADLGADRPRELFCCRPDLPNLHKWVEERLSGGVHETGPGPAGVSALEVILAQPFMLRMPLAYRLEDDDAVISALTPQQFCILDAIMDIPRAAAGGGAGTGKTILACEDARRQAEAGRRTLLTCRSLPLADELRRRFQSTPIEVMTFEELSTLHPASVDSSDPAERLMRGADDHPGFRYDAIIVDEAQDFRNHWWVALNEVLRPGPESRLHAYFDTNQQLYGPVGTQLADFAMVPVRLTRNLRNTRTIHAAASRHYRGPVITAEGPSGLSVAMHPTQEAAILTTAAELIRRLTGTEGVKPADIAVLAPARQTAAAFRRFVPEEVVCSTIMDFKGLERLAIVILATRAIADQAELAYVAISRARTHLVIVGERVILDWLASQQAG